MHWGISQAGQSVENWAVLNLVMSLREGLGLKFRFRIRHFSILVRARDGATVECESSESRCLIQHEASPHSEYHKSLKARSRQHELFLLWCFDENSLLDLSPTMKLPWHSRKAGDCVRACIRSNNERTISSDLNIRTRQCLWWSSMKNVNPQ